MEVRAKPVKDRRLLELTFTFPDLRPHFRSRPSHIISHIIGYEGAGSLLSYLKSAKHWVDSLSVGPTHINAGTELFRLSMYLTKDGLCIFPYRVKRLTQYSPL
jgi:insulysin